jgi:pimeloyl-ACP methyl ester carboxylesterase
VSEQLSQNRSGVGDTVLGGDDRENKVSAAKPTKGQTSGRAQSPAGGPSPVELRHLTLHGHRVAYLQAGSGPVVVLIHGITSSSATWKRVMPYLSRRFTVIAPDLIGHGQSAKPRGDYSLGAYASGLRDLLAAIGHKRASFVGHSLGGGVAMQLSYQFPELCERLVLVDSGGLGREVSLFLRAATLPGSELVLPVLAATRLLEAGRLAGGLLNRLGLRAGTDIQEIARGHATLSDSETRAAFVHTLRGIVDPGGQRVDASDRLYLAKHIPFLLIWGEHDSIIPVAHGRAAHKNVPGSRLEVFSDSGHFPQLDEPERFIDVLVDFIDSTEPATVDADRWRAMLNGGSDLATEA